MSRTVARCALALLVLLTSLACRTDNGTWSLYEGSVTSDSSPDSPAVARLTVSSDGDTAFSGYLEIAEPLARTAGGVWGWYPPDSVAFLTLSATEDTILWTAPRPTTADERLDGSYEVIGGRGDGQGGRWSATLERGSALRPRDSSPVAVPQEPVSRLPWLALILGFVVLSVATGWALQPSSVTRADPATLSATDAQVDGVGGWMIWFLFGQGVTILWTLVELPTAYAPFHDGTWEMGQVLPAFQPILMLELLVSSIQIAAPALGMYLTLTRDPRAPRLWFVYLATMLVYSIVEVVGWQELRSELARSFGQAAADEASKEIASDMMRTARTILWAPIWMAYWSVSRRVRVTFGRGALGRPPDYATMSIVPRHEPASGGGTAAS